jgi:hypothetical protein|eukprot:scaffold1019_cov277-Chaetoceros_neogracile.AAC.15
MSATKDLKKDYDHDAGYYEYDEVYLTSNVRGRGGRRSRAANKDKEGLNVYSSRHVRLKLERKAASRTSNRKKRRD